MNDANRIIDATKVGLTVAIDGNHNLVPWSHITAIDAGRAKLDVADDDWIAVFVVGMDWQGEERIFVMGEIDAVWSAFTVVMTQVLPETAAFAAWGAELGTATKPLQLYRRA